MRRLLIVATAVGVLAAGSVAWSAGGGDGPAQDRVAGGGVFGPGCSDGATPFCLPFARSFSIDANASPHGGRAYGTYMSGNLGSGRTGLVGRVTCLRVEGASAVAGGYIVGAAAGAPDVFFAYLQDRGTPAVAFDGASANFIDFSTSPDLPAGFPRECPPLDNGAFGTGHFPLTGGDVQIIDE